jgi:hypothetical protein
MKTSRILGFAAVMALALTALIGTGIASASQFRAEEYPTSLTGGQVGVPVITTQTGIIKCTSTSLLGTESAAAAAVSVAPTYSGCKSFGVGATIKSNSCHLKLSSTNESAPFKGELGIECAEPGAIEVIPTGLNCVVSIEPQAGIPVSLTNSGSGEERKVTAGVSTSALVYKETGSACSAPGSHANGSYVGEYALGGRNELGSHPVGLYVANLQVEDAPAFHFEKPVAILKAEMTETLSFTTGTAIFKCSGFSSGAAEVSSGATEYEFHPEFSGCKVFGANGSFVTTGCNFRVRPQRGGSGSLSLRCTEGHEMRFSYPPGLVCEVRFPSQGNLPGISWTNAGSGSTRDVNTGVNLKTLVYTEVGANCSTPGTHAGSLSGGLLLRGYEDIAGWPGAQQGIWVS